MGTILPNKTTTGPDPTEADEVVALRCLVEEARLDLDNCNAFQLAMVPEDRTPRGVAVVCLAALADLILHKLEMADQDLWSGAVTRIPAVSLWPSPTRAALDDFARSC